MSLASDIFERKMGYLKKQEDFPASAKYYSACESEAEVCYYKILEAVSELIDVIKEYRKSTYDGSHEQKLYDRCINLIEKKLISGIPEEDEA